MFIPMAKQMWNAIFPDFPIFSGSKNGPNFQQNLHVFRPGSGLFEVKRSKM
jgi:hypothetical protein